MSDQSTYNCKRGIIICQDDKGNYVPFLLKVRGKDIVWGTQPQGVVTTALNNFNANNFRDFIPAVKKKFDYSRWIVTTEDNSDIYTCQIKLTIGSNDFRIGDDNTDIYTTLELPIQIKDNDELSVYYTLRGANEQIATCQINTEYELSKKTGYIRYVKIHLRNLIYSFHNGFKNIDSYRNSHIYLRISGSIKMDNESY